MKKRLLYAGIVFAIVFFLHACYVIYLSPPAGCQDEKISSTSTYLGQQEYFIGYSFALALAFTAYMLPTFLMKEKGGKTGILSGITITGVIYFGGCFMIGCCGSPMIAVYLSIFGSSFLGFANPLIAIITTLSIVLTFLWIRRCKNCNCGSVKNSNLCSH